MRPGTHHTNIINFITKVCIGIAVLLALATSHGPASAAEFWTTQYVSDYGHNFIDSPPAYDTSGSIVAAWTKYATAYKSDKITTPPAIVVAKSPNNGENWTTVSVRSTPVAADVAEATPVVVTDKTGNWVCIWSSNDSVGDTAGRDFDILYSRSTDAGTSWTEPQLLNSTGYNDTGFDVDPWISMDDAGNCIAVWTSDNNLSDVTGTTVSQTAIWMARSSDAGQTWTSAEAITPELGESLSEPGLSSVGNGVFGLVYVSRADLQTTGQIHFSYTDNNGTSWTPSTIVSSPERAVVPELGKYHPAIAGDQNGDWMIVWYSARLQFSSSDVRMEVVRSQTNGSTWEAATYPAFGAQPSFSSGLSVYTDGEGLWCVTQSLGAGRIHVTRNLGTTWASAPSLPDLVRTTYPVIIPEPPESTPYLVKTSNGWIALYGKAPVGTIDIGPFRIRQAKTTMLPVPPASPEWSPATSFLGDAPVPGTSPDIAANDSNTWIAVYVMPATSATTDTEVGFSRSVDGGRTWSSPAVLNTDAGFDTTIDGRPSIAASEGSSWICTWQREDGKIWQSRSLDDGKTWWPAAPVIAGGNPLNGVQPGVASLGDGQWVLAYGAGAIYTVKSTDNGLTWGAPVFVQSGWETGFCGNTSPCSSHGVGGPPRAFATHGQSKMYVGFSLHSSSRPNGYSGSVYTSDSSVGHVSITGGANYEGNLVSSPYIGPSFAGTDEMATNGAGKWMSAKRYRYNNAPSWDISFTTHGDGGSANSSYQVPDVLGRSYSFGTVAMDESDQAFRFWIGSQAYDLAYFSNIVFMSKSSDGGTTWSADQSLSTENPWGAGAPAKIRVKGSATSSFVAVWQANLLSGEPVILYSANNDNNTYTAAKDWQLFD